MPVRELAFKALYDLRQHSVQAVRTTMLSSVSAHMLKLSVLKEKVPIGAHTQAARLFWHFWQVIYQPPAYLRATDGPGIAPL